MSAVDLSLFRFSCPIAIRYRDIDMQQHVNNAVYFTYLETARVGYLRQVLDWNGDWLSVGMILARAEMDYRMPLLLGDDARVHVRVTRLGGKSFDLAYAITRQPYPDEATGDPRLAATAHTVQVAYDYPSGQSVSVPAAWREQIIAYEPGLNTP